LDTLDSLFLVLLISSVLYVRHGEMLATLVEKIKPDYYSEDDLNNKFLVFFRQNNHTGLLTKESRDHGVTQWKTQLGQMIGS
jgi:hypothetical protein